MPANFIDITTTILGYMGTHTVSIHTNRSLYHGSMTILCGTDIHVIMLFVPFGINLIQTHWTKIIIAPVVVILDCDVPYLAIQLLLFDPRFCQNDMFHYPFVTNIWHALRLINRKQSRQAVILWSRRRVFHKINVFHIAGKIYCFHCTDMVSSLGKHLRF